MKRIGYEMTSTAEILMKNCSLLDFDCNFLVSKNKDWKHLEKSHIINVKMTHFVVIGNIN